MLKLHYYWENLQLFKMQNVAVGTAFHALIGVKSNKTNAKYTHLHTVQG